MTPLPKREQVWGWEKEFTEKFIGFNGEDIYMVDDPHGIMDFISHQKSLSRAEVLEEVRDRIKAMWRMSQFEAHPVESSHLGYYNQALSDTLAVVNELEGVK